MAKASASAGSPADLEMRRRESGGHGLTSFLRLYARSRLDQLAREDAGMAQRRVLRELVAKAAGTRFGRQHDFAGIRTVADFQRRVPLRTYGQLWDEFWKKHFPELDNVTWPGLMPFFAVSSSTASGKVKHIPARARWCARTRGPRSSPSSTIWA